MNHKRNTTSIYDIAKDAQVSPATVSRVLSKNGYPVAEPTRRKVLEIADKLNYAPRTVGLPGASDVVVMLPNLSNQFYVTLLSSIEANLRFYGLNTVFMNTRGDLSLERQLVKNLEKRLTLKLIVAPVSDDINHFYNLSNSQSPIVFIERPKAWLNNCTVSYDYAKAGRMMAEYVISRGCHNLSFIGTPLTRNSRKQLFEGAKSAIQQAGLALDQSKIILANEEYSVRQEISPFNMGEQLAKHLMEKNVYPPDAVLCSNDMIALGALRKFVEMGYNVPKEISIIGFDNIFNSAMAYPPLTTIDQCTNNMGALAVNYLFNQNKHVILGPHLVIRDTVK